MPPSKQGKDTLKLLPDTNPHPKADESNTQITKSSLKSQKITEKWPLRNPPLQSQKRPSSKQGEDTLRLLHGTNLHPKADDSTTQSKKNSLQILENNRKRATINSPIQFHKINSSKQGEIPIKIIAGINFHPKADSTTTPSKNSPIKPHKKTEKGHWKITYFNYRKHHPQSKGNTLQKSPGALISTQNHRATLLKADKVP